MLRKIRIGVSLTITLLLTFYIIDFAGLAPSKFAYLAKIQLVPALLALQGFILIGLFLLTFIFGRVYCSSICPLGVYQDIVTWFSHQVNPKKRYRYRKALTALRWSVVVLVLVSFLGGFTFLLGLLDPYSAFARMGTNLMKPAYMAGNNLLTTIFTHFDNHTFYKVSVYLLSIFSTVVALITLAVVGYLAWSNGRIYCNSICPVGTGLGAISNFALFKIRINESSCNSCGTCGRKCKASCIDTKNHLVDYTRCIACFDCLDVCSQSAISYSFSAKIPRKNRKKVTNASRRRFMMALGVTSVAATKLAANKGLIHKNLIPTVRKSPISPPGSLSIAHLMDKCTSCHLCISKCPGSIIKPAFLEYGFGGMMQPTLSFENDFCNYDCTICSDVCPSGALLPLTLEQKHTNKMGNVHFVLENCIVFTDGTDCGACSEHCPTQAVSMIDYKNDLTIPKTDSSICVGCGGCEYICPASPNKAIFVEGIDRHKLIVLKKEEVEKVAIDDFGF
ncbi:MAG: hydroxyacid dehydrogenase [Porphyromonadaceae bacterium CG2_30_38_12]|nr:MAG: hydroxyacid dehydrogenase [Porphyromonadaceae bacterium CG2_30_38_12]